MKKRPHFTTRHIARPSNLLRCVLTWFLLWCGFTATTAMAQELADQIRKIDPVVLTPPRESPDQYRKLLPAAIDAELREVNAKSTRDWLAIKNLEDWNQFRDAKIEALRKAVCHFPDPPKDLKAQTTKTLDGEGFKIECLIFESRPGFIVTANLYVPDPLAASAPGIIIQPSHHNPKTQGELQDMGMTWARAGCYVLIMDQVGHGERAAHPFTSEQSYPKPFRAGRQDYWFRYNTGMQLHLTGDSLIGWQAYDLMRGVDLLLTRSHIDRKRIIMMGSVAGGGDPVAVTAALDQRITAAVIFNFGGPQPETRFPLPDDAKETFNYAGSGGWESTRNLSFCARDGSLPWVIVASIAPRKLIYAHEFSWDRERDPVWKRLQKIYEWHGAPESLSFAHGYGSVRESGDKASHCNNIGPTHRKHIHPALEKWFNIPQAKEEYSKRRPATELLAMPGALEPKRTRLTLYEAASQVERRASPAPGGATNNDAVEAARKRWIALLGDVAPPSTLKSETRPPQSVAEGDIVIHRFVLQVDGLPLPGLLLVPKQAGATKPPVTLMVAQHGKAAFIQERSKEIAALLQSGVAVCLPDVRGTGELRLDRDRRRTSWDTSVSSSALMLGKPMLGQRLRDLRAVMAWLRKRDDVNAKHLAIWGDSFAPVNGPLVNVAVPHGVDESPAQCEPLGGLLALLGGLFEDDVKAVFIQRGLYDFQSGLTTPFPLIPHDVVVPGMIRTGSQGAFAEDGELTMLLAIHGRSVQMAAPIDAMNKSAGFEDAMKISKERLSRVGGGVDPAMVDFILTDARPASAEIAAWIKERLHKQ